jgi:ABC-type transport system involved in multi-copper enzyme maturation permease subunit
VIRFAWLQSRTRTILAAALLAALAVAAAITGVQLAHLSDDLLGNCRSNCGLAADAFLSHDQFLQNALNPLVQVVPGLLGAFWGAPLLGRELETGTYRLAWSQSVPRSRWLITKLGLNGLAAIVVAGLLSLTVTWWYRSIDLLGAYRFAVLDRRDLAPIGYAAFAFALGALLGAVLRRTVPAMAGTLAVFVFARIAVTLWVRPHLLPPVHRIASLLSAHQFGFLKSAGSPVTLVAGGSAPPGAWTLSTSFITDSGHVATSTQLAEFVRRYCPRIGEPPARGSGRATVAPPHAVADFDACRSRAAHTFRLLVTYQPASRYWAFQWLETGLFVVLALMAAAGCYWWIVRRTS